MDATAPMVALIARSLGPDTVSLKLEHALRRRNRVVVTYSDGNELVALISLTAVPSGAARAERAQLIGDATEGISGQNRVVAVGPLAGGVGEAGYSLAEARLTFDLAELSPSHGTERGAQPVVQPSISQAAGVVLDADSAAVERLAYRQMQPDVRRRFVDAFLSDLLHHDSVRGTRLLDTLNCWLDLGCNTAEAARKLHLERQSMHNRLQRIFELIGGDPRGGGRMAGIHLATKMARRFPAAVPSD
jgi:purine catabolism regulator